MSRTRDEVAVLVLEQAERSGVEEPSESTGLWDGFGPDSLALVELVTLLDDALPVPLAEDDVVRCATLGDLVELCVRVDAGG